MKNNEDQVQQLPKYAREWSAVIVGAVFTAFGAFLVWVLLLIVIGHLQKNTWAVLQADINRIEPFVAKDKKGYEHNFLRVFYSYAYQDKQYHAQIENDIADDTEGSQGELFENLTNAFANHFPVQVWVNPDNPQESVLSHSFKPITFILVLLFTSVFVLVGLLSLCYGLFNANSYVAHKDAATKPWLGYRDWSQAEIVSHKKPKIFLLACLVYFINVASVIFWIRFPWLLVDRQILPLLLNSIVPLLGLYSLLALVKTLIKGRGFDRMVLKMDPHPGAIGGHVGGSLEIYTPYNSSNQFEVTVRCLSYTLVSRGENRQESRIVLWQGGIIAESTGSATNTQLKFYIEVPENLPESQVQSDHYHKWYLDVKCNDKRVKCNREFEIPVFATGERSCLVFDENNATKITPQAKLGTDAVVCDYAGGFEIYCPPFRHWMLNLMAIFMGLVFTGFGVVAHGIFYIFLLVGGIILGVGLYKLFKSLHVNVTEKYFSITRKFCGFVIARYRYSLSDVQYVSAMETTSLGENGYYKVIAYMNNGKKITVAEDIKGRKVAEVTLEGIVGRTGLRSK